MNGSKQSLIQICFPWLIYEKTSQGISLLNGYQHTTKLKWLN